MRWMTGWKQRGPYRIASVISVGVCLAVLLILSLSHSAQRFLSTSPRLGLSSNTGHDSWVWDARRDAHNYGLTSEQCDAAFPGLFAEIDNAVQRRRQTHITEEELTRETWPAGTVRVLVWEQEVS